MHTRYKDEAAGSHGFGTTDPTCLQGIRTGLQYLTGKEHQTYMPTVGLHDQTGKEQQFHMHMRYQDGAA